MNNQRTALFQFEQNEEKLDHRVKKTRHKVIEVMIRNFEKEGWFDGNISLLCKRAGINRTTFYDNFKDLDGLESYAECLESLEIVTRIEKETEEIKEFTDKMFLVLDKLIDVLEERKERLYKAFKVDIKQSVYSMLNFLIAELIMEIFPLKKDDLECNAKVRMICGGVNYYLHYEYRKKEHSAPDIIKKICYSLAKPFFDCFKDFENSAESQ